MDTCHLIHGIFNIIKNPSKINIHFNGFFHGNFMKFMIHLKFSWALKNAIFRGFFMA